MSIRALTDEEIKKLRGEPTITKVPGYKTATKVLNKVGSKLQTPKAQERLQICENCTYFNKELITCSKCGCSMKLKTSINSMHCPIGKW